MINWFVGPIINGIALYEGMLGYALDPFSAGWCWIYHNPSKDACDKYVISNKELLWIFIDGKGIEIFVYTTIFIIYGVIKFKLHKEVRQTISYFFRYCFDTTSVKNMRRPKSIFLSWNKIME